MAQLFGIISVSFCGMITVEQSPVPSSPEQLQRYFRAAEVFTPSAPIDSQELFAGRREQLSQVISAVAQKGQHVILYGERGVGKTSFSNVISQIMRSVSEQKVCSTRINCDGIDDFTSLWQKIFRELESTRSHTNIPPEEITPESIRFLLQTNSRSNRTIIVIDELDRIGNPVATELMADTVKTLSDHLVDVTLILVGVADSVNELIEKHASIERSLVQVQMPRMSINELYELLDKRLQLLNMNIDSSVREKIAFLSQGLPSYTHLLALHSSQNAILRNSDCIEHSDFSIAVKMSVDKAFQSIVDAYHRAISSARATNYAQVLLACALAKKDDLGFFAPADVREPMSLVMKKPYSIPAFARHLNDLCEDKRGPLLAKRGSPRNYRFRFINPMMQPHILAHGLANGLIDQADLRHL